MPGTPSSTHADRTRRHGATAASLLEARPVEVRVSDARTAGSPRLPDAPRPLRPLFNLDPGWLFLISGIALIAAVVLIPAQHDLDEARWQRDRAIAIERHRVERLSRYGEYLAALRSDDESVLLSLAATQLNMSPSDRIPLQPITNPSRVSASVFPALEPPPLVLPPNPADRPGNAKDLSILERLSINDRSRLWVMAGGVLCVLFGLLPATSKAAAGMTATAANSAFEIANSAVTDANARIAVIRRRRAEAEAASRQALDEDTELDADDATHDLDTDDEAEDVEAGGVAEFDDDEDEAGSDDEDSR